MPRLWWRHIPSWRLKPTACRVLVKQLARANIKIRARVQHYRHFCRKYTDDQRIPLTKTMKCSDLKQLLIDASVLHFMIPFKAYDIEISDIVLDLKHVLKANSKVIRSIWYHPNSTYLSVARYRLPFKCLNVLSIISSISLTMISYTKTNTE